MAVLQAYQADVLKDMDEGAGLTLETVKELWRATDLALRLMKHTARAVGLSMVGLVTVEIHLWLNLTEIREQDKTFLLNIPISQSGLFGDAVVEKILVFSRPRLGCFHSLSLSSSGSAVDFSSTFHVAGRQETAPAFPSKGFEDLCWTHQPVA